MTIAQCMSMKLINLQPIEIQFFTSKCNLDKGNDN